MCVRVKRRERDSKERHWPKTTTQFVVVVVAVDDVTRNSKTPTDDERDTATSISCCCCNSCTSTFISFTHLFCFLFFSFLVFFIHVSVRPSVVEQRFTTFTSVTLSLFVGAVILGKTSSLSSLLFFVNSLSIIIGCCCCCWVGSSVLLLFLSWVELSWSSGAGEIICTALCDGGGVVFVIDDTMM